MSAEDDVIKLQAVYVYVSAMCQMFNINVNDVYSLFSVSDRITFTDEDIASLIDEPLPEQKLPPISPIVIEGLEGGFRVRKNSKLFIIIALVVILQISMTDAISRQSLIDQKSASASPPPPQAAGASASPPPPQAGASASPPPPQAGASASPPPPPERIPGWFEMLKLDYEQLTKKDTNLFLNGITGILISRNLSLIAFIAITAFVFLGHLFSFLTIVSFLIRFLSQRGSTPLLKLFTLGSGAEIALSSAVTAGAFAIAFLFVKNYFDEQNRLPQLEDGEIQLFTKDDVYKNDIKHFRNPPVWWWLDLNIRINRLREIKNDINTKLNPQPVAQPVAQPVVQPVAGVLAVRNNNRRNSMSKAKKVELVNDQKLLTLVTEFITRLNFIKENFRYVPHYLYGENFFASKESFVRGLQTAFFYNAGFFTVGAGVVGASGATEEALAFRGGASYICEGITNLIAGVYVIFILLIILVFISRFIDSFEPNGKVDPNLYQDFLKRVGSIEDIKLTVIQIYQTMFDNVIYTWIKNVVIPDLITRFLTREFLNQLFFGTVAATASGVAAKTGGPLDKILDKLKVYGYTVKDIIYFISNIGKYVFLGINCLSGGLYNFHNWVYTRLLSGCGFVLNFTQKDIDELPQLVGKVLDENIPKLKVASTFPNAIKEEDKLLLKSTLTTVVLDKSKIRINPILYKNFENSIISRPTRSKRRTSRPSSRKRTASRPSRKRTASRPSRKRTASPSRARAKSKRSRR